MIDGKADSMRKKRPWDVSGVEWLSLVVVVYFYYFVGSLFRRYREMFWL